MIRVGVIGTGFGRVAHLPALRTIPGVRIAGVASGRPEHARQAAAAFAIPRAFETWEALIDAPEIDAVTIATPTATHATIALRALRARKAVLCEKPLALTLDEAARMREVARGARVVNAVSFVFREIPALRLAQEMVAAGMLGQLRHAHVTWLTSGGADPRRAWTWRSARSQGGGVLYQRGVHVFDYLEWLAGPLRRVMARLTTRVALRPDAHGRPRRVTAEDCTDLLLEFRDGTPGALVLSSVAPQGQGHWITLHGDAQSLRLGSDDPRDYEKGFGLWLGGRGGRTWRRVTIPQRLQFERTFAASGVAPFRAVAQRFVLALQRRRPQDVPSFADGYRAQVLLDAALRSDRVRGWVDVSASPPQPRRLALSQAAASA